MEFSIIIPARDRVDLLEKLLKSIQEFAPKEIEHEVIVIDDGSRQSLEAITEKYGARCIRRETSEGPAGARNEGARQAKSDRLVFLDSDVIISPGFLETAKKALDSDEEMQCVSFLNQSYDPSDNVVSNFGAAIESYWFSQYRTDKTAGVKKAPGFGPRCGAIRKRAFDEIGGFDQSFKTNAHEDYDFGKRLAERFRLGVASEPILYHRYPDSLWRMARNCFVRTALFIPYQMENPRPLYETQISRNEGLIRLAGCLAVLLGLVALFPLPARWLAAVISPALLALYFVGIWGFLNSARKVSESWLFPVCCFFIHLLTSQAIIAGGCWGMACLFAKRLKRQEDK